MTIFKKTVLLGAMALVFCGFSSAGNVQTVKKIGAAAFSAQKNY